MPDHRALFEKSGLLLSFGKKNTIFTEIKRTFSDINIQNFTLALESESVEDVFQGGDIESAFDSFHGIF